LHWLLGAALTGAESAELQEVLEEANVILASNLALLSFHVVK